MNGWTDWQGGGGRRGEGWGLEHALQADDYRKKGQKNAMLYNKTIFN